MNRIIIILFVGFLLGVAITPGHVAGTFATAFTPFAIACSVIMGAAVGIRLINLFKDKQ